METSLPLNINDVAFDVYISQPPPTFCWTDATVSLVRYACYTVHRLILRQSAAEKKGLTDFKSIKLLINNRKKDTEQRYLVHLDDNIPLQRCGKLAGRLLTARFDNMLLNQHLREDPYSKTQINIRRRYVP